MKEKEDCLANMLRYVKKTDVRLDGLLIQESECRLYNNRVEILCN